MQVQEPASEAQEYLEELQKRVKLQVKNPFSLPMLNYSFEELSNWKNVICQLDTSSRLYGLRVDSLHDDTVKAVHHLLRTNQHDLEDKLLPQSSTAQNHGELNIILHIDKPQKINAQIDTNDKDPCLWNFIFKKCDNLEQTMLNTLTLATNIELMLDASQSYCPLALEQPHQEVSHCIPTKVAEYFGIFQQISNFSVSIQDSLLMANISPKNQKRESISIDIDLQLGNFDPSEIFNNHTINPQFSDITGIFNNDPPQESENVIQENNWNEPETEPKKGVRVEMNIIEPYRIPEFRQKINRDVKARKRRVQNPEHQQPSLVFNNFIDSSMFFKTKFVPHLLQRQIPNSYLKSNPFTLVEYNTHEIKPLQPEQQPNFCHNFGAEFHETGLSSMYQQKKVSVKEMKQKILIEVKMAKGRNQACSLSSLKLKFSEQDPLNILTAILHLAAQQQFYLRSEGKDMIIG